MERSNAGSVFVTLTFRCSRQSRTDQRPSAGCQLSWSSLRPAVTACPSALIASICASIACKSACMPEIWHTKAFVLTSTKTFVLWQYDSAHQWRAGDLECAVDPRTEHGARGP